MDVVDDGLYIKFVRSSGNAGLFVWPGVSVVHVCYFAIHKIF